MTKSRNMKIGPNNTTLKSAIDFLQIQMMIRKYNLDREGMDYMGNQKKFEDVIYFLNEELEKRNAGQGECIPADRQRAR